MTDVLHRSGEPVYEQLALDVDLGQRPEDTSPVPLDVVEEIVHSPAYLELRDLRDEAHDRHRSGARAIARGAFAALQAGDLPRDEYMLLFESPRRLPADEPFETLSAEPPERELDWMERAAGEGVVRPGEDE